MSRSLALVGLAAVLSAACSSAPPPPHSAPAGPRPPTVTMSPALLQRTDAPPPAKPPAPPPPPPSDATGDDAAQANAVRAAIVAEVSNHFPKLRACYDRGTDKTPGLAGRVTVRFVVAPSGDVVAVDEEGTSTLNDPDTVSCVKNEFAGMRFPQWTGKAVSVVYPMEFSLQK